MLVLTLEITPSPIPRGTDCEVNPDRPTLLFYQQLVIVLTALVTDGGTRRINWLTKCRTLCEPIKICVSCISVLLSLTGRD